jgi:hypothetical protein
MLLDISKLTIEELTGRLKAIYGRKLSPIKPTTAGGKLLLTEEQWRARQGERNKGEASSSTSVRKCKPRKERKAPQPRRGADGGNSSERKATCSDTCHNCGNAGHWAKDCRLPKCGGQAHVAESQVDDELALFLMHGSVELRSSLVPAVTALLHFDEPRAYAFLGKGASDEKIDGWYLDTGATHHMTGWREYYSDLDSTMIGSVKFGDTSAVEIEGAGSVIFIAKTGEHRLLTGVYYNQRCGTRSLAWDSWMRTGRAWKSSTDSYASGTVVAVFLIR